MFIQFRKKSVKAIISFVLFTSLLSASVPSAYAATSVEYQPETLQEMIAYLFGILTQLKEQLAAQNSAGNSSTRQIDPNPYFTIAVTLAPSSVLRTEVTLLGEVDKGSSEYADVWFEYGTGGRFTKKTEVQEVVDTSRNTITVVIDGLQPNTPYNYRVVIEDEDGNRQYGQTRTFTTITKARTQSFSGLPSIETEGATDISSDSAEVTAFISMNDYYDGVIFVAYGTQRSWVNAVINYDEFEDIPVIEEKTEKYIVSEEFNGRDAVTMSVSNMPSASTVYYRVCVQYKNRGDEFRCGEVEKFVTLN